MKNIFRFLLLAISLSTVTLQADVNEEGHGFVKPDKIDRTAPFHIEYGSNRVKKAKITTKKFEDEKLGFAEAQIEAGMIFYYNPVCKEGAQLTIGYTQTDLNWSDNPYFDDTRFNTMTVCLGTFSHRLYDWLWKAQGCVNFDSDIANWEYLNYDLLLWGRYEYCHNINLHVGFLAETGMKIDRVFPLLGFDWKINEKWKLNMVFPVDVSLVYSLTDNWALSVDGRFFDSRHRVGKDEPLSRGLFAYRAAGVEFAVNYHVSNWIKADLHIGSTTKGKLTVADRHYEHKKHIKFDGSGYFGANAEIQF